MNILRQPLKSQLIADGRWPEFIKRCGALQGMGLDEEEACGTATGEFLGNDAALVATEKLEISHRKAVYKEADRMRKIAEREARERSVAAEKAKIKESATTETNLDKNVISSMPGPPPPVKRYLFKNKPEAGEIENITWVCDNMRIVDVEVKDCPSMRAWNLLCECRESSKFREAFWKDHYGKIIPPKNTLDTGKTGKKDGKVTMDLIDKIRAISAKAQGKNTTEEAGDGTQEA